MPNGNSKPGLSDAATDVSVWVLLFLVVVALFGSYFAIGVGFFDNFVGWVREFFANKRSLTVWGAFFTALNIGLVAITVVVIRWRLELLRKPLPAETQKAAFSPKEEVKKNWEHIQELADSTSPSDWNMAILHADSLLDDVLRRLGYVGETIAERLKIVDPTRLKSLERVWSAHRLRNMIAHEPMEHHTKETIASALRSYAQALKELGMMEEVAAEVVTEKAEKKMP